MPQKYLRYPSVFIKFPCREIRGRTRPSRTAREAYEGVGGGFSIYAGPPRSLYATFSDL